jgi:hypothetical protein
MIGTMPSILNSLNMLTSISSHRAPALSKEVALAHSKLRTSPRNFEAAQFPSTIKHRDSSSVVEHISFLTAGKSKIVLVAGPRPVSWPIFLLFKGILLDREISLRLRIGCLRSTVLSTQSSRRVAVEGSREFYVPQRRIGSSFRTSRIEACNPMTRTGKL